MSNRVFLILLSTLLLLNCSVKNKNQIANQEFSVQGKKVLLYTTADNTNLRLNLTEEKLFKPARQPLENEVGIFVNPNKTFQTFIGIGGALTDASAEVFAKLPSEKQDELLKAYYDPKDGIGYTVARTPINSCDFSSESHIYVSDEDKTLKTFNIAHDKKYRIPLIKKAIQAAQGGLLLFASPWSPPAYMKDTKDMLHGGKLLPEYYQSWALYYTKFIKAYENEGIPVWGITIQNEPLAKQIWESCIYTAEEERDFLKNYLGPVMRNEGLGDKKIIVWDHNRDFICQRANTILDDPEASQYVWGVGFHWYESWAGGESMYNNLVNVLESYPEKKLFFTEGCVGGFDPQKYQYWPNAERYGKSMINDFNSGTVGWTDWNILLDETGGPNHVGNFCFAPIHADTQEGELIYTPSYYYIGHFSKFVRPGAKRVSTTSSRSHLLCTSFINTNGKMVTIVMNQSDNKIPYKLFINLDAVDSTILPHSIQTYIY